MPVKKIKLPDSSVIDINDSRIHIYRTLTGTAADTVSPYSHTKWDVTDSTVTEYVDGMVVCIKVPVAGHGTYGTGLQINSLGYKPVVYNVNSMVSTRYGVGSVIWCVYNATQTASLYINSTSAVTVTGCWQVQDYDANTNTIGYQLRTNSSTRPVSSTTYRYRLMFSSLDNSQWVPANNSTSTNATSSRTVNQEVINPWGRIVYYSTTAARTAGQSLSATAQWDRYVFNLGYSFNTGTALDLTFPGPVYIKCAPQASGGAIIDSTTPYTQALPSSADGKIYIYLGQAYSASEVELIDYHPVLYHDGGGIRVWTGKRPFSGDYGDLANAPTLATVATSGSYNDLVDKPAIPDPVVGSYEDDNWTSITIGTVTKSIAASMDISLSDHILYLGGVPSVTVTVTAGTGGTASASSQSVPYGGSVTITATPSSGYRFTKWSDNNTSNPRTLTNLQENVTLSASFVQCFSVTVTAGTGGTAEASANTVDYGGSVTLTANEGDGYLFTQWSDGNTTNPRVITNVQSDITLSASFTQAAVLKVYPYRTQVWAEPSLVGNEESAFTINGISVNGYNPGVSGGGNGWQKSLGEFDTWYEKKFPIGTSITLSFITRDPSSDDYQMYDEFEHSDMGYCYFTFDSAGLSINEDYTSIPTNPYTFTIGTGEYNVFASYLTNWNDW